MHCLSVSVSPVLWQVNRTVKHVFPVVAKPQVALVVFRCQRLHIFVETWKFNQQLFTNVYLSGWREENSKNSKSALKKIPEMISLKFWLNFQIRWLQYCGCRVTTCSPCLLCGRLKINSSPERPHQGHAEAHEKTGLWLVWPHRTMNSAVLQYGF